jgi:UDP-N-acetylmuramyl pentapeptide phosphotransferase/UDP-N-acetylglucosamine-1-phosphate transferase
MKMKKRITLALGEAHIRVANVMTTPNPNVRFWIITMLLVLIGLSTLKLR